MAKILLLDFAPEDARRLQADKWDTEVRETNWKSGKVESLVPPLDCQLIFFQVNLGDAGAGLHIGDAANFEAILQQGGAVVCFLGAAEEFHLENLFGPIPGLKLEVNKRPNFINFIPDEPAGLMLREFNSDIIQSLELFTEEGEEKRIIPVTEAQETSPEQVEVLARSYRRRPVAAKIKKGKGYLFLLPWFGDKNIEVVRFMLRQVLPTAMPHLFEENPFAWVESPEYYFPALTSIFQEIQEESRRHRETIFQLRNKAEEVKKTEQQPFTHLLTSQGERLKQAVLHAFKYISWPEVIDVDQYWKRVIRIKEEDIWLIDDQEDRAVEEKIRTSPLILVIIRSGLGSAPESDLGVLQKYKARRMQEFDNTKMKALLVGNYHYRQEARSRPIPFTQEQIEEAVTDGNGLLTTADLYFAIKAEKENKITREEIIRSIREKTGLITFEY